jgi:polyphosphate kinase 2 (PPK2 family)
MKTKHLPGPPMLRKEILEPAFHRYVAPFRIVKGKGFRLKDFDPGDTCGLTLDKADAAELLQRGTAWLAEVQDMLYAQDRWSLLVVFQAMDAAGKDSTIKHVMSGVNPQGCQVFSFKQPSPEELDHDYLWRYAKTCPSAGGSGSSIGPTMKRFSWCACTKSSWNGRRCPM